MATKKLKGLIHASHILQAVIHSRAASLTNYPIHARSFSASWSECGHPDLFEITLKALRLYQFGRHQTAICFCEFSCNIAQWLRWNQFSVVCCAWLWSSFIFDDEPSYNFPLIRYVYIHCKLYAVTSDVKKQLPTMIRNVPNMFPASVSLDAVQAASIVLAQAADSCKRGQLGRVQLRSQIQCYDEIATHESSAGSGPTLHKVDGTDTQHVGM